MIWNRKAIGLDTSRLLHSASVLAITRLGLRLGDSASRKGETVELEGLCPADHVQVPGLQVRVVSVTFQIYIEPEQ